MNTMYEKVKTFIMKIQTNASLLLYLLLPEYSCAFVFTCCPVEVSVKAVDFARLHHTTCQSVDLSESSRFAQVHSRDSS